MSYKGVLEVSLVNEGVTGEDFKEFLEEKLSTVLFPYNGTNPNSIIVMDNAAIHHVDGVVDLLEKLGVLIYYLQLPPLWSRYESN